jgi:tetrahydromethanopterin:alpha-L-glutamate ligase
MTPDIVVLGAGGWHWTRLQEAIAAEGLSVDRLSFAACALAPAGGSSGIRLGGLDRLPRAVLVRFVPAGTLEQITFRLGILHGLEAAGVVVVNAPRAIERCVDKSATSFFLAQAGVPTPPSWAVERREDAAAILADEMAAGHRLVLKPLFGSQGKGLRLLREPDELPGEEEVAGVWYLQRYVGAGSGWRDFRVLVVDGAPVAAMARHGMGWVTNIRQGGLPAPVPAGGELGRLAAAAAQAVGCAYAGVDLIEASGDGRLLVLEVNSMPAWQGLQSVSKVDIARTLARALARRIGR